MAAGATTIKRGRQQCIKAPVPENMVMWLSLAIIVGSLARSDSDGSKTVERAKPMIHAHPCTVSVTSSICHQKQKRSKRLSIEIHWSWMGTNHAHRAMISENSFFHTIHQLSKLAFITCHHLLASVLIMSFSFQTCPSHLINPINLNTSPQLWTRHASSASFCPTAAHACPLHILQPDR